MTMDKTGQEQLVHRTVAPGTSSGVYYIPVSNLAPTMTFNSLKSIARQAGSVEKCFVYPNSCEGWVRVRGHAQFLRVYGHLNGFDYEGYIITASSENESSPAVIWESKRPQDNTDTSRHYAPDVHCGYSSECYPSTDGGHALAEYSGYYGSYDQSTPSLGYDSGYHSRESSSSVGCQYATYASDPSADLAATFSSLSCDESSGNGDGAAMGAWHAQEATSDCYHYPDAATAATAASAALAAQVGKLKVIVKNLSRHASHKELESYLLRAVGGKNKLQEAVRFPRLGLAGSTRQHAFLLFNTHDDACAAVERLNRVKLLGLVVEARFATEPVPAHQLSRSSPSSPSSYDMSAAAVALTAADAGSVGAGGQAAGEDPCKPAWPSVAWPSLTSDGDESQRGSHNLVVDGTSEYARSTKPEDPKGRDRKHRK